MPNRTILLADDDSEDKAIIQEAMEQLNADVVLWLAEHGEDALHQLEKNTKAGTLPCLIVLDLNMPKMNGVQTLRNLKSDARFKDIPVIIYSTSINPLEKETCLKLGAETYVTKPISLKESIETAKKLLRFCYP